jgi:TPR repeat protein
VPRSPSDALLWYERGADRGSPNAAYEIGWIYANIEPINYIDAIRWYRIAAAYQHREAQNNIGVLYEAGLGIEQDYVQAAYWYQLASNAGLARAQYQLAQLYLNGRGVERNSDRAAELMAAAAHGGDSQAQAWLALHP